LLDLLEPWLRTLLRTAIVVGERAGNRAPEQVRCGGDEPMGGELIGVRNNIGVDAVNRRSKHNCRNLPVDLRNVQIAIKLAAFVRADLYPLPGHRMPPVCCRTTTF
jgi:hypothetical protein